MDNRTIISVKNLVKNYGNFQAIKGISFDVVEGEIFGLLGPNGRQINYAGDNRNIKVKNEREVIVDGLNLDKDRTK
jgi:ABC-2 type transport system ATP-binding protein